MGFVLVTRVGCASRDPRVLAVLALGFLRGVVASNRVLFREAKRRGKTFPLLYKSGVEYEREPWTDHEEFADAATVLRRGWGDCDDLAAWRAAELQEMGECADVHIYWRPRNKRTGQLTMHVEVRRGSVCPNCKMKQATGAPTKARPNLAVCKSCNSQVVPYGLIEDPSRFLGL